MGVGAGVSALVAAETSKVRCRMKRTSRHVRNSQELAKAELKALSILLMQDILPNAIL